MSVQYEAKMIIGAPAKESKIFAAIEDLADWAEDQGMEVCFPWCNADSPEWIIGFEVDDWNVKNMGPEFLESLKKKAEKFEELSGIYGQLICALDVG